ncbi:hypothetical protein [Mangrovibacterium sp.]|uniref:hypothetical protein n=1 Tax=Mangrovibacterium sp. TaxID=1961364 RepID=UPI00356783F9
MNAFSVPGSLSLSTASFTGGDAPDTPSEFPRKIAPKPAGKLNPEGIKPFITPNEIGGNQAPKWVE